jgi:PAS domain S-box-containing protein
MNRDRTLSRRDEALSHAGVGVCAFSADGSLISADEGASRLLGLDTTSLRSGALVKTPIADLLPDPSTILTCIVDTLRSGGLRDRVVQVTTVSGEVIPLVIDGIAGREVDGSTTVHLVMRHNTRPQSVAGRIGMHFEQQIDAYRRREEELRRNDIYHRAMIDAMPDLIMCMKRDGTIVDIKPQSPDPLGVDREALIGANITEFDLPDGVADTILRVAAEGLDGGTHESLYFSVGDRGEQRQYEARVVPFREQQVLLIARDISNRKHVE